MDEQTAFCRHCNAPQIRVSIPEAPPPAPAETFGDASPRQPISSARMNWPQALPSAALAGMVAVLVMVVPLGAFGFALLAGGALAALFYRRRNPAAEMAPALGARLGALSGIIGFGLITIVLALSLTLFHGGGEVRQVIAQAMDQAVARSSDPQAARQALAVLQSPQGFVLLLVLGLIFMFVIFTLVSSAGGALAAVLLRRRRAATTQPPQAAESAKFPHAESQDSSKDGSV